MSAPPRLSPGDVIGGKYRLESRLARGGMGSVWTARHLELGNQVAIKFMDAPSPQAQARFAREAKASAGLRHPNIVDVSDYGVDDDRPYLVMELLRGEDLGERLKKRGRLSLAETAALLSQLARALRGAHETGIIHRDLKPSNVFLARIDEDEEVPKLLDFGIAKDTTAATVEGESTRTGEIIGSPHYMSPEQVRGVRDLDARSDIWSLGVIVFRCLTGRLPFPGEVIGAVIGQILADPIPVATSVAPDLPPEIDAFFARVLARDRTQRFANVREMAAALAALSGAPPGRGQMSSVPDGYLGTFTPDRLSAPASAPISSQPPHLSTGAPVVIVPRPPPLADGEEPTKEMPVTRASAELQADLLNDAAAALSSSGTLQSSGVQVAVPGSAVEPPPPAPPPARPKRAVVGLAIGVMSIAGVILGLALFRLSSGPPPPSPSPVAAATATVPMVDTTPVQASSPPPVATPPGEASAPASAASSSAAPPMFSASAAAPGSASLHGGPLPVTSAAASAKKKLPALGF